MLRFATASEGGSCAGWSSCSDPSYGLANTSTSVDTLGRARVLSRVGVAKAAEEARIADRLPPMTLLAQAIHVLRCRRYIANPGMIDWPGACEDTRRIRWPAGIPPHVFVRQARQLRGSWSSLRHRQASAPASTAVARLC